MKTFPRPKLCGEFISPECFPHFEELGVDVRMNSAGGACIDETVFYEPRGASLTFPSSWFGAGGVALGLSRAEMDAVLLDRARESGAEILENTAVTGLRMAKRPYRNARTEIGDRDDFRP